MTHFTVYKIATGEILRTGTCLEEDILLQAHNETEAVLSALADYKTECVINAAILQLPPRPSEYAIFDYIAFEWKDSRTAESQWLVIREERNKRLQSTDWTQLADIPAATKSLWEPYRQALRDVTLQPDPFNITWPTPPQ